MLSPMPAKPCAHCRLIRTILLSLLCGAGAGFAVLAYGGSTELSMALTFCAALVFLLPKYRYAPGDDVSGDSDSPSAEPSEVRE